MAIFFFRNVNTIVLLARRYLVFSPLIVRYSINFLTTLFFFSEKTETTLSLSFSCKMPQI